MDNVFTEQMLIYENDMKEIRPLSQKGAEKITFPQSVSGGQTDIFNHRVATLLKYKANFTPEAQLFH